MSVFCSKRSLLLVCLYLRRHIIPIPKLTEFAVDNSGYQLIVRRMSCRTFYLTNRLKFQWTLGKLLNSVDSAPSESAVESMVQSAAESAGVESVADFNKSPRPGGLVKLSPLALDKFDMRRTHIESVGVRGGVGGYTSVPPRSRPRRGSIWSNRSQMSPFRTLVEPRRTRVHQLDRPPLATLTFQDLLFLYLQFLTYCTSPAPLFLKYFLPLDLLLSFHLMYSISICPSYID